MSQKEENSHVCPGCQKEFDTADSLNGHWASMTRIDDDHSGSYAMEYSNCNQCGQEFGYYTSERFGKFCYDCGNTKKANRNFFSEIDTEEKAYWLGFILADGCINKTNGSYRLSILIGRKDKKHLENFKRDIESRHKISKPQGKVSISIKGGNLCSDLISHGIVPRKSDKADPRKANVPDALKRHFWRGVIDGDGYMGIVADDIRINLTGSKKTCEAFRKYVVNQIGVDTEASPYNTGGSTYSLTMGGNKSPKKIIKHLYDDSSISLDRKQEIANEVIDVDDGWWTDAEIEILKKKYPTDGSDIDEIDRSSKAIRLKACRIGISYEGKGG